LPGEISSPIDHPSVFYNSGDEAETWYVEGEKHPPPPRAIQTLQCHQALGVIYVNPHSIPHLKSDSIHMCIRKQHETALETQRFAAHDCRAADQPKTLIGRSILDGITDPQARQASATCNS
jgi:hypothetical protein